MKWRIANGDPAAGWNTATNGTLTPQAVGGITSVTGSWNPVAETTDNTRTPAVTLSARTPVLLDVQVCLSYSAGDQCTWDAAHPTQVMRLPHAFGDGYPTTAAGPGQVALFTGEFNTDTTDVSVPGYTGSISLSRSHSTYGNSPSAATDDVTGVFGPGWTAALDGSDAGLGGLQAVDSTRIDGTISFIDTDGTALTYIRPGTSPRRTTADLTATPATPVKFTPLDEDTLLSGTTLTVQGSAAATTLTLTEDDGTKTAFSPSTAAQAPTSAAAGLFSPSSVTEPGSLTTSYTRDATGRVTRILAPLPPGTVAATGRAVTCPDGPVTGLDKGCRALRITYGNGTTIGTATPVLAKQVTAELYNPATLTTTDCAGAPLTIPAGMAAVPVACYTYDATNHLTSVKDPRTGLTTSYTYGSGNQLLTVTTAGQSAITLGYTTLESRLKLTGVTRPQAAPLTGTANLTRVLYRAPLSDPGVLPDLTSTAVAAWAQPKAPKYAAAVFGPDYTGTLTQAADTADATGSASDWSYADLSYTTADGYTVNTASYGASQWLRTATDYDDNGNVTRQLDAGAIQEITTAGLNPGLANLRSTQTVYNTDADGTFTIDEDGTTGPGVPVSKVLTPAGTLVKDTYGPQRNAVLADGTMKVVRPHTQTTYDQGAPTSTNGAGINPDTLAPYRLPTTVTTTAAGGDGLDLAGQTISSTTTEYGSTTASWGLGQPTKTTTGGISTLTAYDSVGRTTQTRQPMAAAAGNDAMTMNTQYYTADASAPDASCDNKPEWAGLPCLTNPVANAATTGTPADGPATLPSTATTGYSIWLAPTTTQETSGTATRTTTTTMDAAGRTTKTETTTANLVSTSRPAVYTHYDPTTGQVDYAGTTNPLNINLSDDENKTALYDAWGRPVTTRAETNGGYDSTVTSYDDAGRVATVTDPKGTTTTSYDGAQERRGLATKVTITRAGATGGTGTLDFTGSYDADGALTTQVLPGGITATTTYDEAGEPTGLNYSGQVTPVTGYDADGNPTYGTPEPGSWLNWSQDNDISGRVRKEYTDSGASFDPSSSGVTSLDQVVASTGTAVAYDRAYTYEGAGRLTTVADRTADATGITLDPGTDPTTTAPCTTRTYGFDDNGRRNALQEVKHADGNCASAGGTSLKDLTYAHDTADRPTTAAAGTIGGVAAATGVYTYDAFGRQIVIPAADAPNTAAGPISLGYYDDDLARTITQGGSTTTLDLDSGGRRTKSTTVSGASTSVLERHYADRSDNPAWTINTISGVSTTTRYAESVGGDLSASISDDGSANLSLANLHGDVVTTVPIAATAASGESAAGISGWSDFTEYGAPRTGSTTPETGGVIGYGWLGAKQRSTTAETAGLTLMGDRLYNAATGRFTSLDPVPGGNDTAYNYPTDPMNSFDLDGHFNWRKWRNRGATAFANASGWGPNRTYGASGCFGGFCAGVSYQGGGFSASVGGLGHYKPYGGSRASRLWHRFKHHAKGISGYAYAGYAHRRVYQHGNTYNSIGGAYRYGGYYNVGTTQRNGRARVNWGDWEGGVSMGRGAHFAAMRSWTWRPKPLRFLA